MRRHLNYGPYLRVTGSNPFPATAVAETNNWAGSTALIHGSPPHAILTGRVYVDANGDGTQQPGEPGAAGLNVFIIDVEGNSITVVTDANGDWTADVAQGQTDIVTYPFEGSFMSIFPRVPRSVRVPTPAGPRR